MSDSVLTSIHSTTGKATLAAALIAATAQVMFQSADAVGVDTIAQALVQIGAPVALGAAAANLAVPWQQDKLTSQLNVEHIIKRGVVAGAITSAVLVAAGALPAVVDTQLLALVALVGGSVAIGDYFVVNWGLLTARGK